MSETKTVWHKYPEVPLPETAYAWKDFSAYKSEFRVLAWAELPEPYTPREVNS